MSSHRRGARYEAVAAGYLEARGWEVIGSNVRFGRKEIDLIVRRGSLVAFVEVKGRAAWRHGDPLEAITARKRREIETVARWWVEREGDPGDMYRFDAVAVYERGGSEPSVRHVEDAWRPG